MPLLHETECFSEKTICSYLPDRYRGNPITVLDTVDSTNTYLKRMALDGAPHGTAVFARVQIAGRGRQGRSFYSPEDTGLYASLLLRPSVPVTEGQLYTVYAAVAACRAIETACGQHPQIKWVNDLFLNGRKICGILAESVCTPGSGRIDGVVIGVGINLTTSDFPEELRGIAGSLETAVSRSRLAAALLEELLQYGDGAFPADLLDAYRARSLVLGRTVSFTHNGTDCEGRVDAINDAGNLVVTLPDGGQQTLVAGEIRVRI